jgi:hypothetical protein
MRLAPHLQMMVWPCKF